MAGGGGLRFCGGELECSCAIVVGAVGLFIVGAVVFALMPDADGGVVVLSVSALSIVDGGVGVEACIVGVVGVAAIIPNTRNN